VLTAEKAGVHPTDGDAVTEFAERSNDDLAA